LTTGPSVFLEKAWTWFDVEGAAGLRLGGIRLAGNTTKTASGSSLVSPWAGPFLGVRARIGRARGFAVDFGGEVGVAPFAVQGEIVGSTPVSVVGIWVGAYVGGVYSF
jgi:hypothetical protein